MSNRSVRMLIPILVLVAAFTWVVLPDNPGIHIGSFNRDIRIVRGLDLQGGLRILLEADLAPDAKISMDQMQTARNIVENRVNALGVSEPLVQLAGARRILVELPGIADPDQAVATIKETGLLEFVEVQATDYAFLSENAAILTDFGQTSGPATVSPEASQPSETLAAATVTTQPDETVTAALPSPTLETSEPTETLAAASATTQPGETAPAPLPAATLEVSEPTETPAPATATTQPSETPPASSPTPGPKVFHTVMTGSVLKDAYASRDEAGQFFVGFVLTDDGTKAFADYTSAHVGDLLAIVLDKQVVSVPRIQDPITDGAGRITGDFTLEDANRLAVQLRYGALPVPLKPAEIKTVGPTLGQDSLRKSTFAGVIGLVVVVVFMVAYYGLPGVLADLALLVYAVTTFALFKLIPVTLTLPGVAGFVLSIGVAVDANILIFERMREELRGGRSLRQAIDLGFSRAWPSIRDSNLSTLITCGILYWFGSTFGASIVKGFSLTLALGVMVSLFTAITVTRTFLHLVLDRIDLASHLRLFGV